MTDGEIRVPVTQRLARLLADFSALNVTSHDLYNERRKQGAPELLQTTRMQFLLDLLSDEDYFVRHKVDDQGHLSHLFFALKDALRVYRANLDVVPLYCTCSTNRFGMPLLNIHEHNDPPCTSAPPWRDEDRLRVEPHTTQVPDGNGGHRSTSSLPVRPRLCATKCTRDRVRGCPSPALRVAHSERRRDVCTMKIIPQEVDLDKSTAQTRKMKDSAQHRLFCDTFGGLVGAANENAYRVLREQLYSISAAEAKYFDDIWLDIWRDRLVRCWTDQRLNFGLRSTSRVEGYHNSLKRWLISSHGDLLTLHKTTQHWWRQSIKAYDIAVSNAWVRSVASLRSPLYSKVVKLIHNFALLEFERLLEHDAQRPCTSVYMRSRGMPCSHMLAARKRAGRALLPEDFHAHWYTDRSNAPIRAPPVVFDPSTIAERRGARALQRRTRTQEQGQARSSHRQGEGMWSTRRTPSSFERPLSEPAIADTGLPLPPALDTILRQHGARDDLARFHPYI
ncbi:hypothetical protein PybrP1_010592 [[Pythium] brassicae (nom. inval.)]|nr:hypothetical protein PybrP1_010592 [[Pythium] brassicae (nom. inval.)]